MVIDSFKAGRSRRPAAEPIITRYGGRVEVLALTHPHADHFEGFIDLIDRYDEAILGCVYPRDSRGTRDLSADSITLLGDFQNLNRHAAMKVPHHGSREAIHPSYADGDPGRFWVITPFYLQRLPRHEDANSRGEQEGLRQVLSFVDRVHLTALPFRHDKETDEPVITTRQSLMRGDHPRKTEERPASLLETDAALDRQLVVGFTPDGAIAQV